MKKYGTPSSYKRTFSTIGVRMRLIQGTYSVESTIITPIDIALNKSGYSKVGVVEFSGVDTEGNCLYQPGKDAD